MADVALHDVSKVQAGGTTTVAHLTMDVADRELLVLLGPSGSGKTTVLRMVAGLEPVTEGTIRIGGRTVTGLDPRERNIAMVAQGFGLYPHHTARGNMSFALKLRRTPKAEIERRVNAEANVLGLREFLERMPRTLSAGQQQAVALGRAMVRVPDVFLMDEPLAHLDAKRRLRLRAEIAQVQQGLGTTMLYVTNDQVEAMALGTRVGVLDDGVLQQLDRPQTLYDRPSNTFVATFVGSPPMNLIDGRVRIGARWDWLELGNQRVRLPTRLPPLVRSYADQPLVAGIRPEHLSDAALSYADDSARVLFSTVTHVERTGWDVYARFNLGAPPVAWTARLSPTSGAAPGRRVELRVDTDRLHLFEPRTGAAVWHSGPTR